MLREPHTTGGFRAAIISAVLLPAWLWPVSAADAQCVYEWKPGQGIPGLNGPVFAMTVWDDGGGAALYVGGQFTIAGDVQVNNIAKWNGSTWSALGSGLGGTLPSVLALVVHNGTLIAGGHFTTAGGASANSIARWNGSTWSALSSGLDNDVNALTVYSGALFVGGIFTTAGGIPASRIAKWDGAWSALGNGVSGGAAPAVFALQVYNGELIVGGRFTTAEATPANRMARWNGTTATWATLGVGPGNGTNNDVYALDVYNTQLVAGGAFGSAGGLTASRIATWNGTSWAALGMGITGMGSTVRTLGVYSGELIAGGDFVTAGGGSANDIAKWNPASGGTWSALGSGMNNTVRALSVYSGELIAGGQFTSAGALGVDRIAKWNGSLWSAPGAGNGMSAWVTAFVNYNSNLIAVGEFTSAGSTPANRVAQWNGSTWSALGTGMNVQVDAITLYNGEPVAGGQFTTAGGVPASHLAKWNGSAWSALGSGVDSLVWALTVYNGELIAGGEFTTAGGVTGRNYIAKWNGSSWSALVSGMNNHVYALAVYNGELIAGGAFTTAGGAPANYIARWNGTTWSPLGGGTGGVLPEVLALCVYNNDLIAGGGFATAGGELVNGIAKWNGALWSALGPGVNSQVKTLSVYSGELIAGGAFTSVGGMPANNVAKWNGGGWQSLGNGANAYLRALGVYNNELIAGGNFTTADGDVSAYWARWAPVYSGRIYVDADATGSNDGTSWLNAYHSLDTALMDLCPGTTEMWVAAGTYLPTQLSNLDDPRSATFNLPDGVAIYGGFAGTETLLSQRNWTLNETKLTNDDSNSRNVVTAIGVGPTTRLDGFTIQADTAAPTEAVHEFFVNGSPTLANNIIKTVGDHYLDLDPDPAPLSLHPVMIDNKIQVMVKRDEICGKEGSLLELRALDRDCPPIPGDDCAPPLPPGCITPPPPLGNLVCASGVRLLTNNSAGFCDFWALDKLTIKAGAKLNLTNRQDLDFNGCDIPDALYVKDVFIESGASLNSSLQTLYYQNLHNDGLPLRDIPLLGFSLVSINMNCQEEYDTRVQARRNDGAMQGAVFLDPDARGPSDGVMEMATLSAVSVAAKGAFARVGKTEDVTIVFQYLFQENPHAEVVVSLSDTPEVGATPCGSSYCCINGRCEVARVHMPVPGRPGSIGSGQFATFFGKFSHGSLDFTRGTYVELELRGLNAQGNTNPPVASRVWIDNFDPNITACCSCGDLNFNGCTADSQDYLVLLAEYGQSLGQASLAKKACLDQVYGGDHYVDLMDLLGWDSVMDPDHPPPNACGIGIARADQNPASKESPTPHPLTASVDTLLITGKPNQPGQQSDYLYSVDTSGGCVGSAQAPAGADDTHPTSRSNGRLIQDQDGNIYQLHAALGLLQLGTEAVTDRQVVPPNSFDVGGDMIYVGIHSVVINDESGATPPLTDVAFGRTESTKDFAYAAPVLVIPQNTEQCPYRVAAKLQLERGTNGVFNGNYNLITLYGTNPATDPECTITSESCTVGQATDVQHVREVEIDTDGHLYVLAAQALTAGNEWLLIYDQDTGSSSEIRVPLSVPGPSALLWSATDDKLYLTSSINSIPDPNNSDLPGGDVDIFFYNVSDVLAYTPPTPPDPQVGLEPGGSIRITYPVSDDLGFGYLSTITSFVENAGTLYAVGFTMPRFDPDISPNDSVFNGATGKINAAPALAVIDVNSNPTAVTGDEIDCNDLGLPLAMIYVPGTSPPERSIMHWRSVRTHGGSTDLPIELAPLASGNGGTGPTVETRSGGIQKIEVEFDGSVNVSNAANITVTGAGSPTFTASTSGNLLTLNFTGGMSDQVCYTITIGPGALGETITTGNQCRIRSLEGDGTSNGTVNLGDVLYTKKHIGQAAAAFPNLDYNLTGGTINSADMLAAKAQVSSPAKKALCQ